MPSLFHWSIYMHIYTYTSIHNSWHIQKNINNVYVNFKQNKIKVTLYDWQSKNTEHCQKLVPTYVPSPFGGVCPLLISRGSQNIPGSVFWFPC